MQNKILFIPLLFISALVAQPSFTAADIATTANGAESVYVADLDNDGDLDIVSASYADNTIAWYENDGAANPSWSAADIATNAYGATSVFAADMDGDGDLDIVSASYQYDSIAWYENDGAADPSFTTTEIATSADGAYSVYVADLDNDGDLDIVSASDSDDTIAWYENDGAADPSFTAADIATSADGAQSVFAADMDNDGDMDVVSASWSDDAIAWYENNGAADPLFSATDIATSADGAKSVFAADMDNDGDLDIISASQKDDAIAWYENNLAVSATPAFGSAGNHISGTNVDQPSSVFAIDLDSDGDEDILSSSIGDHQISWFENNGAADPSFTFHSISIAATEATDVFAIDLDRDGDIDVLSAAQGSSAGIDWYENNGSQTFSKRNITVNTQYAQSVFAIDLDRDGDIDVLSASSSDDKIEWYENDGGTDPSFTAREVSNNVDGASDVRAIDVDGDGDIDVLSAGRNGDEVAWHENNGSESFTKRVITTNAKTVNEVFGVDLDRDGHIDVLSANEDDNKIKWYKNNGSQSFTELTIGTGEGPFDVYAADMDNDGDIDVLSGSYSGGSNINWHINDGSQSFTQASIENDNIGTDLRSVYAADLDNDGDLDVMGAFGNGNKVAWYEFSIDNTAPTISLVTLAGNNRSIEVRFNENVYNTNGATGDLEASDFSFSLSGGIGTLSSTTPTSISRNGNIYTLGIGIDELANGDETLTVQPVANSIYDGSGNVASTSQSNNSIKLNYRLISNWLKMDGNNDYLRSSAPSSYFFNNEKSFTIEAWYKTPKNAAVNEVSIIGNYSKGQEASTVADIRIKGSADTNNSGKIFFVCAGLQNVEGFLSSRRIDDDKWHHIAVVYDRDNDNSVHTASIYIDGILDAELTIASPNNHGNSNYISGGGYLHWSSSNRYRLGEMSATRISVGARYKSNFIPPLIYTIDSETKAAWNFNENSGLVLNDITNNNLDLTIYGDETYVWGRAPNIKTHSGSTLEVPNNKENTVHTKELNVTDTGTIQDADIKLSMSSGNVEYLGFVLISPDGTPVTLTNTGEKNGTFNNTIFDDEGSLTWNQSTSPFSGRYQVKNNNASRLADLDGESIKGVWKLVVFTATNASASIDWTLYLDINSSTPSTKRSYDKSYSGSALEVPNNKEHTVHTKELNVTDTGTIQDADIKLSMSSGNVEHLAFVLISPDGTPITLKNNIGTAGAFYETIFDDEATLTYSEGKDSYTHRYQVKNNNGSQLDHLDGESIKGVWKLVAYTETNASASIDWTLYLDIDSSTPSTKRSYDRIYSGSTLEVPNNKENTVHTKELKITDSGKLEDIDIKLSMASGNVEYLGISVIAPNGSITKLTQTGKRYGTFYETIFDDQATTVWPSDTRATFSGRYLPDPQYGESTALSGLKGLDIKGDWKLSVYTSSNASASIDWSLMFDIDSIPPSAPKNLIANPPRDIISFNNINPQINLSWSANPEPDVVKYYISNGPEANPISNHDSTETNSITRRAAGNLWDIGYYRARAVDHVGNISDYSDQYMFRNSKRYFDTDSTSMMNTFGVLEYDIFNSAKKTNDNGFIIIGSTGENAASRMLLIKADRDGDFQWYKIIGNNQSWGYSVKQTPDGGYIAQGTKYNPSTERHELYVVKTDQYGDTQWQKTFNGTSVFYGSAGNFNGGSLDITSDGGYIILSNYYSNFLTLFKLNAAGEEQWSKRYGTYPDSKDRYAKNVYQTADGGYIFYGRFLLVKTDANGNQEWSNTDLDIEMGVGNNVSTELHYLDLAPDGGYILAGRKYTLNVGNNIRVVKVNKSGALEWEYIDEDPNTTNVARTIKAEPNGGYIVGSWDWGSCKVYSSTKNAFLLTKLDDDGQEKWQRIVKKENEYVNDDNKCGDYIQDILIIEPGQYLLVGSTKWGVSNSNNSHDGIILNYRAPAPTIVITDANSEGPVTRTDRIKIAINFSFKVTGFEKNDIVVTNATIDDFSGSDDSYSFYLVPSAEGVVTINIPANVAQDNSGNENYASKQFSIRYDTTKPTLTISSTESSPTDTTKIPITVIFSEAVTGFGEESDFSITNGTISNLKGTGKTYTFDINPDSDGQVLLAVNSGAVQDSAGNANAASDMYKIIYDSNMFVDHFENLNGWTNTTNSTRSNEEWYIDNNGYSGKGARSDVGGMGSGDQLSRSFTFNSRVYAKLWVRYQAGDAVRISFKVDGQEVWNANFSNTPGSTWTQKNALIDPGTRTISIETDVAGWAWIDELEIGTNFAPIPTILSSAGTHTNITPIPIAINFSIPVTDFTIDDIVITGATKSNFSGSEYSYQFNATPAGEGPIVINIPENIAKDAEGIFNVASEEFVIMYDITSPTVALSSSLDSPTHSSSIPIDITFSESVINFNSDPFDLDIYNSEVIGGSFSGSDSLYTVKLMPLNDGLVRLFVKDEPSDYTDLAGNPPADFQNPFEIYYDNLPPAIVLTDPVNSGTLDTLIVEWAASDTSKIQKFELYTSYNGQSYSLSDSVLGETFSYDLILPNQIITQNQIMIKATDQWGLFSYDTSATFTISDNDPPVISILSPVQTTIVNEYDSLLVKWEATDNLSIDVTKIFLSIDGGSNYKEVASEVDSTIRSKKIKIPMGASTAAMIKVSSIDASSNTGYSESEAFTIIDKTPPTVSFSSPEPNDRFEIGTAVTINWIGEDNVAVEDIKIAYSINLGSDWDDVLIAKNNINQTYQWIMPNIISSNIMLRTVVFDAVGLSDTAIVNNIISYPMYPTIVSIEPTAGVLRWLEEDISITFNRAMDSASFTQQNVIINTLRSNAPEINYIANDKKLVIHKSGGYSSLDTIQIQLKANGLLSTFGYAMDGNNNSLPGGDSTLAYYSLMLADFDTTNGIDGSDLAIMLDALDNKDNTYDIGPVINSVPYFLVQPDNKLDIEDIMSFAMMWNWYSESNSLGKIEGPAINPVDIQYDHRGIAINFPDNATIAEVYIQNTSEELSYQIVDNPYFISMEYYDQKLNRLSYLAEKNRDGTVEIPFTISGKTIDLDITYRFVDRFGNVVSFESQTLEIENIPETFSLYQNYPNPFNPTTTIFYDLPIDTDIELAIYDITGRKVKVLVNEFQLKGYKSFKWNGKDNYGKKLGSGLYFYQLQAKNFTKTKKMIMLK